MRSTRRILSAAAASLLVCSVCAASPDSNSAKPKSSAVKPVKVVFTEQQLEKLARALKQANAGPAYAQLSAVASRRSSGTLGVRAALALGYYDYGKGNYAQAAKWLAKGVNDPLLAEYALYWDAETELAEGRSALALDELKRFRGEYPDSVLTDAVLQSLGDAALAANKPAEAAAALDAYSQTTQRPALLFLRGEVREKAGQALDAAADYQAVYLRFATSEPAREAATKLDFLRGTLGANFPALALDQRLEHAAMLIGAKSWNDEHNEYGALLPELTGADQERAQLRILECGMALGSGPNEIAALQIADPDVDAERFDALAEYYRTQQKSRR